MIDFNAPPLKDVIEILLRDMNSGGNILLDGRQLTKKFLPTIKPRAQKTFDEKISRTRSIAEVFTPSHVVKFMVDALDDEKIDSRWLEIACGEAPFITNRYDAETGKKIPLDKRAGILDKKFRGAKNFSEAKRAVQSVYGYEIQGDSLLIARANVLLSFAEAAGKISDSDLAEVAEIVAWNFFQFDGMTEPPAQTSLFDDAPACEIIDWNAERKFIFGGNAMKKFDFVISNPPYQEEKEDNGRQPPVYHKFMEAAFKVGEKVALITPARFLFEAGQTPKDFNRRMLDDPHFKVLDYAPDARKYFKGVDIKGGVAITLRDETKNFGAIGTFSKFPELNAIQNKVVADNENFRSFSEIVHTPIAYKFSEKFFSERPELLCKLQKPDDNVLRTNIFERVPEIFFDAKPDDGEEYVQILGRLDNKRYYKFVARKYIIHSDLIEGFKIFVNEANGTGTLGELITMPVIGEPFVGCTQTFITVGAFDTRAEAEACLKYIKSKFARAMLGILKVTQHNPPATWAKVPLQNFSSASDIDWSGAVDEQLYRKYKLDATEINFIETHVKED